MKIKMQILSLLLVLVLLLAGCGTVTPPAGGSGTTGGNPPSGNLPPPGGQNPPGGQTPPPGGQNPPGGGENPPAGGSTDSTQDDTAYGESLESLGAWDGYFETDEKDIEITCLTGSGNRYRIDGDVLTFNPMAADSVYTISGKWKGSIVINTGDDYKFTLEMHGFSLVSTDKNPITVMSGDEVSITAKKGYDNYIYDMREAVDENDTTLHAGAVYATVDLEIAGKGNLTVVSENNNGIHTKDDLQVKNLSLLVYCTDNALKGNDSVEIVSGDLTLIATAGDGIKTTSSDISSKGNQRGTVSITGGTHEIYAACDGIDAAYDTVIDDALTTLNIYTDKYSAYSKEITAVTEDIYYIRFPMQGYSFSVKYYNADDDILWVNATYHSTVTDGFQSYYYYTLPQNTGYAKMQFFIYEEGSAQGQEEDYVAATELLSPNPAYDTFAFIMRGSTLAGGWTNYTTAIGRPGGGMGGGMQEGNPEKSERSTKGIKAANEIVIRAGEVNIKSYDDGLHAKNDTALENGQTPLGNLTVSGGSLTVYSNDDGLHADANLLISGGTVTVTHSYEGLEGGTVTVSRGKVSVTALDDGVNGTENVRGAVTVSGGELYIYCQGDGIDSNSRIAHAGILFTGGSTVVISNSNGNSAIDSEAGYGYTGGQVLAMMPAGGMLNETLNCQNFETVGTAANITANEGATVTVKVGGEIQLTVPLPCDLSGKAIYLGANNAEVSAS